MSLLPIPPGPPFIASRQLKVGGGGNRAVIFGDSITAQNFAGNTITAISSTGGVGSFTVSSSVGYYPGAKVYITGTYVNPDGTIGTGGIPEALHGVKTIISGSGTNWTFDATGAPDGGSIGTAPFPRAYNLSQFIDIGWFVWGQILANQPFDLVGFSASTGRYTAEALQRISEVTQYNANYAFVLLGTNDTSGATEANLPMSQVFANLTAIWQTFLKAGTKVVAITIPPQGGSTPSTATVNDRVDRLNKFIRDTVRATPGMYLLDMYAALVNPVSATIGQPLAGMINQTDGLHPTTRGAYTVGKAFAALVPSILPVVDIRTNTNGDNRGATANSANILDSAPWVTSGATPDTPVTGTLPTGWRALRQGTPAINPAMSVVSRADGVGYDVKCDMTGGANGDGIFVLSNSSASTTLQSRLPSAPFSLSLINTMKVTGQAGSNLYTINSYYSVTVGANTGDITALGSSIYTSASENVPEDWSGTLRTPPVTFSTKPTAITVSPMRAFVSAAGTAFSAQFGRASLLLS